jgi:tyrosyl-tRNA synthetase
MQLSGLLKERGYVYQHSSPTLEELTDTPRTLYLGVDPTADSMHVGQLMGMLVLRRFIDHGHKVIVIVGGGTGMIGDPGGKSAERNLLGDATVRRNTEALRAQFSRLFGGQDFVMVNNAEWLHGLNYMEFLRDIGKHFTVNEMIKRDSVRPRLETQDQSISYTEFSYMLLQAYDFLELHLRYGCDLQVGGSDQWGNIVSGVELIRKKTGQQAYALSWPLLTDKTGKKFGKSEGNAVWLDAQKTSPLDFYQFWYNVEDEMVEELLLKMTLMPREEIRSIINAHDFERGARIAQKELARAVTALVHGHDARIEVESASSVLFGDGDISAVPAVPVQMGETVIGALVSTGLANSKSAARQLIAGGGVYLDGSTVSADRQFSESERGRRKLQVGKKHVRIIHIS